MMDHTPLRLSCKNLDTPQHSSRRNGSLTWNLSFRLKMLERPHSLDRKWWRSDLFKTLGKECRCQEPCLLSFSHAIHKYANKSKGREARASLTPEAFHRASLRRLLVSSPTLVWFAILRTTRMIISLCSANPASFAPTKSAMGQA